MKISIPFVEELWPLHSQYMKEKATYTKQKRSLTTNGDGPSFKCLHEANSGRLSIPRPAGKNTPIIHSI